MSIPGNWGLCSYLLLFSCSVVSYSLWSPGLQQATLLCPSLSPGAYSNSGPLSRWCHPTILSSVITFSSCLPSFPALGSFLMSHLFISRGQSIGALASVLPVNTHDWFPLGLTGLISLLSKGFSRVFYTSIKINFKEILIFKNAIDLSDVNLDQSESPP